VAAGWVRGRFVESFDLQERTRIEDMNRAIGAPVSDPARRPESLGPHRIGKSALRFIEKESRLKWWRIAPLPPGVLLRL
jgi:hypothetical protein